MKIAITFIMALFACLNAYGQDKKETIKKLDEAYNYYVSSFKKANSALVYIEQCYDVTLDIKGVQTCAYLASTEAGNARKYTGYAEDLSGDGEKMASLSCPSAVGEVDDAGEYFYEAEGNFDSASSLLSKASLSNDASIVAYSIHNARIYLRNGLEELDKGYDKITKAISTLQYGCR